MASSVLFIITLSSIRTSCFLHDTKHSTSVTTPSCPCLSVLHSTPQQGPGQVPPNLQRGVTFTATPTGASFSTHCLPRPHSDYMHDTTSHTQFSVPAPHESIKSARRHGLVVPALCRPSFAPLYLRFPQ
ncbi:hypothetical protein E2C01_025079 [Portunus trituberculatus]|uniref:Secreted protein n=1 Tax=Portunus trituberculatus TaxID=210409 RepID=A0A5B7EFL2_PORTR|nr:hypothetical protein [Portunus trituberculatus]